MKESYHKSQEKKRKLPSKLNQAAQYSSLAFEMLFIILAGVFGGIKLDEKFDTSPIFAALLSLGGVVLAIYIAIKDFLRNPKENGRK